MTQEPIQKKKVRVKPADLKGTWLVPQNLKGLDTSLLLQSQSQNSDALFKTLEHSFSIHEKQKTAATWKRTYTKKFWFPFLDNRMVGLENVNDFSQWWRKKIADIKGVKNISKLSQKESRPLTKADAFYSKYFHGGFQHRVSKDKAFLSWDVWKGQPNRLLYAREDCILHLGGGRFVLGNVETIQLLKSLIEFLSFRESDPDYFNKAVFLQKYGVTIEESYGQIASELDDPNELSGLEDTLEEENTLNQTEEALLQKIKVSIDVNKVNLSIEKKYDAQMRWRSYVDRLEKSLKNQPMRKEILDSQELTYGDFYQNYVGLDTLTKAIIINAKNLSKAITRNSLSVLEKLIKIEPYPDVLEDDKIESTRIETILGDLVVERCLVKSNAILRAERSQLLGNGVVPQTCSIVTKELVQSIISENYVREYLPIGFNSMEDFERQIADDPKKRILLHKAYRYKDKVKLDGEDDNLGINLNILSEKFPFGRRWPTPTVSDANNAELEAPIVNCLKKQKDTKIKLDELSIDRQEMILSASIHRQDLEQEGILPFTIEKNPESTNYDAEKRYPKRNVCVNQTWVESLMGLSGGWTQPLFGWSLEGSEYDPNDPKTIIKAKLVKTQITTK